MMFNVRKDEEPPMCSFLVITVRSRSKVSHLKSQRAETASHNMYGTSRYNKYPRIPCNASLIFSPIPQAGLTHVRVGPAPWTGTRFRQIRCIYSGLPALCINGVKTGRVLLNACTGDGFKKINAARVCNMH